MKQRKNLALFLAGVLLATALLFWPEQKEPGENGARPKATAESQSLEADKPQKASETTAEETKPEQETTFWYWKGAESGVPCEAYLILCSDGTYILRTVLAQHDPQEETGRYLWKGEQREILQLQSPSGILRGTLHNQTLQLEKRTYEKTTCNPL